MHKPWHKQRKDVTENGYTKRKESTNQCKTIEEEKALLDFNVEVITDFEVNCGNNLIIFFCV